MFYRYLMTDIETVANEKAIELFAAREYAAPANYKDPEKIAANIEEQRKKDIERAALHWTTGQIVSIAVAAEFLPKAYVWSGLDEKKILINFFDFLRGQVNFCLSGKNYLDFDAPFIVGRAMVNNLVLPPQFRDIGMLGDIDFIFGRSSRSNQRASLSDYAFALGIPGKTKGISGKDIAGLVAAGEWQTIEEYNAQDSNICVEIMKRYLREV